MCSCHVLGGPLLVNFCVAPIIDDFDFFVIYRLRHERLKRTPKDVGGPNAYQTLTCFDLEDTPKLPNPPSSASIDDPFDITI